MTLLNTFDTLEVGGVTVSSSLTGNECLYNLLTIDESAILSTIKAMDNIYDLGKNEEALNYIEKLVLGFISSSTEEYTNCITTIFSNQTSVYDCDIHNISEGPIDLLRELMKLPTNTQNYSEEEIDRVVNRILVYIPDVIKKIIEISESYERSKCAKPSYNTKVLKKLNNKVIKDNSIDFSLPSLGFDDFFSGFQDNIISKSILLLFVAFVIGKIIGLFNIQYNINK